MSFAGAPSSIVESITLCGVEPGHVDQVSVHKGLLEIVCERTSTDGISAGHRLAKRAAIAGRKGMRMELGELLTENGPSLPLVVAAWLTPDQAGAPLQVVVTYR